MLVCLDPSHSAYNADTWPPERAYIKGRLKYIGDGLGIKYSHILSQVSQQHHHCVSPVHTVTDLSLTAQAAPRPPAVHAHPVRRADG